MKLIMLLKLQLLYLIFGLAYNLISLIMFYSGGKALSETSPLLGAVTLLIYGLFLLTGFAGKQKAYRVLMLVAFVVLGYGGVISHILNYSNLELYYSATVWLVAILINLYGAVLNLIAFTGHYKTADADA